MGKIDIVSKQYLSNPVFFADAFNYHLYGGRQIIKPDELKEMDTLELAVPHKDETWMPVQRFRDVMKQWVIKSGSNAVYALLGCEPQQYIDFAMPARVMLLDSMNYDKQIRATAASHHTAGEQRAGNNEFLSGFRKADRLIPVITLVIFFSPSEWDGPRSIHEMLAFQDQALLKYVPDYKLNLITPEEINPGDFKKFHSGLGKVLEFSKYSDDRDQVKQMFQKSGVFVMDADSLNLLSTIFSINVKKAQKEDEVDLCKAWDDWGIEMKEKGLEEGRQHGWESAFVSLVNDGTLSVKAAASRAGISEERMNQIIHENLLQG